MDHRRFGYRKVVSVRRFRHASSSCARFDTWHDLARHARFGRPTAVDTSGRWGTVEGRGGFRRRRGLRPSGRRSGQGRDSGRQRDIDGEAPWQVRRPQGPSLHPEAGRAVRGAARRPARVPAHRDAARHVGARGLRDRRQGPRRERDPARPRPGHAGRHPAGRHGGPEDGRPGDLLLGPDVEPDPAHRRVSGDHRPRQRHPADARRELGGVRRPQDLDLQAAPGGDVAQWRGVRRRPRGLERRALAQSRSRLVQHRPVDLRQHGLGRGGRQAHGALQPEQAGAVGAGGLLQLSDRDPPPLVRAAVLGQSDRHRALHARASRSRSATAASSSGSPRPPTARSSSTGASSPISTRSTTTTSTPTTS